MLIEEITPQNTIEKQLLDCYRKNQWRQIDLDEAQDFDVEILVSPLFVETFSQKVLNNPSVAKKYEEFKNSKKNNPLQNYGARDYPMIGKGPIGQQVPGIRHAHLTQDISVFYTIEGRNPTKIKLFGVFGHADSGTGTPSNIKRQQAVGKQMKNQQF